VKLPQNMSVFHICYIQFTYKRDLHINFFDFGDGCYLEARLPLNVRPMAERRPSHLQGKSPGNEVDYVTAFYKPVYFSVSFPAK